MAMIGMLLAMLLPQELALAAADAADPVAIATRLDVTSFPNSLGPRRAEGLHTFADFGFDQVRRDGTAAVVEPDDQSWVFRVIVLDRSGKTAKLCILDRALNGGTYFTVKPIEVEQGRDGLFHATDTGVTDRRCG